MAVVPTSDELRELEAFGRPHCVTVYAPPAEPSGASKDSPGRIVIKNLLNRAEAELLCDGVAPRDVRKTLRPARELIASKAFRPLHDEGFALFVHPELFRFYHLPAGLPQLVSVGSGFRLGPLLEVTSDNRSYLVLVLSHQHVRMFEGDRFRIRELHLRQLPTNMEQALNIDEYPNTARSRNASPASNRRRSEITHNEYSESQTDKDALSLFFRQVDASLRKFLQRKGEPVVLAGVAYLLPIYRRANTSPYLVPGGLAGNFEREKPDAIRERAWRLVIDAEGRL